jgi:DNA-binding NarL/FixJ family response regulator
MRVFLCDDNPEYRYLARVALERAGHTIVGEAGNGADAVARAGAADPDVVLLDLNLAGRSGLDALPSLREAVPGARIVILTSGQASDERARSLAAGADGFIAKPERIFTLGDELRAALGDD